MGTLYFSIELWRSYFDIVVFHPLGSSTKPVKFCLELVPPVSANGFDAKRKFFNDVIYKLGLRSLGSAWRRSVRLVCGSRHQWPCTGNVYIHFLLNPSATAPLHPP